MTTMLPLSPEIVSNRDIFVMAGQSNGSGRGLLSECPTFSLASRIKVFANDWAWKAGAEPTDDKNGQIDTVSSDPSNPGVSAGMAFGQRYCELKPDRDVGLVPCAMGGTYLSQWARNMSRTTLYGSMLARTQKAAEQGNLKGVLWYQGETDSTDANLAQTYASRLSAIIAYFRYDIGIQNLLWVVTELGPNPGITAWPTVQAQIRSMDNGADILCVSAADLAVRPDDIIHLSTAGQVALGIRYAEAIA